MIPGVDQIHPRRAVGEKVFVVHVTDEMFGKGSLWKGEQNKRRYTFSTLNKKFCGIKCECYCMCVCVCVFIRFACVYIIRQFNMSDVCTLLYYKMYAYVYFF